MSSDFPPHIPPATLLSYKSPDGYCACCPNILSTLPPYTPMWSGGRRKNNLTLRTRNGYPPICRKYNCAKLTSCVTGDQSTRECLAINTSNVGWGKITHLDFRKQKFWVLGLSSVPSSPSPVLNPQQYSVTLETPHNYYG